MKNNIEVRSTIVIKVKKEDIGKSIKADITKLHFKDFADLVKEYGKETARKYFEKGKINLPDANKFICRVEEIDLCPYLEIFCNMDGYVDGVGKALLNKFGTYEKALNLILSGNNYTITNGEIIPYIALGRETGTLWDSFKPMGHDEIPKVSEPYQYIFVADSNEWYYRTIKDEIWEPVKNYGYK